MHKHNTSSLHRGHGNVILDIFIEPTCPFSVTALKKVEPLLALMGEDNITVKLRIQSQPWHLLGGAVARCVLAAAKLDDGRDAAWTVLNAIADHREAFVLNHHATGANRQISIDTIIQRIESYSGIPLAAAFNQIDLQDDIKWHAKYARQNGIHASPTFMLNGLIEPAMSSGDRIEDWAQIIAAAPRH